MESTPTAPTWTAEELQAALVAAVRGEWTVALLYRRGGQERPEDVVGCTVRLDGDGPGKLALTLSEWTARDGKRGHSVRAVCALGGESAVIDIETMTAPTPETLAKFVRELQRLVSVADDGAAWKAWRKQSR